jgi:hypothetical protein
MGGLFNVSLTANQRQEIERGQAALNRRRAEFVYMANGSRTQENRPEAPEITRPTLEACTEYKCSEYPQQVSFYTLMGVHAARRYSGSGGAWRLYALAKALDGHGREARGHVELDRLRAFALHLGVHPKSFRRWYKSAVSIGLFDDPVQNKRGAWRLILPSAGKAAYYMGADDIGRKATMSAGDLIGKGWKARVWAAYEAARGLQISRERLQKTVNVPVSTQRYRDNQAGVNRQANYAQSNYKADSLSMLKEYGHYKGLFVANNKSVYWRLPDTRTTDIATDAGKSRGRKAKAELRYLQEQEHNGAFKMQRANGDDLDVNSIEFFRLFCHTPAQRKASEKKISRQDNFNVTEIYQAAYENKESGAGIWDVFGQM